MDDVRITQENIDALFSHMHPLEKEAIIALLDPLDIEDDNERNSLLALALCEYELLEKTAAVVSERQMEPVIEDLFDDYNKSRENCDRDAWNSRARRIIYYSQAFLARQTSDNKFFSDILEGRPSLGKKFAERSTFFSFDEAYKEGDRKFEALATDFWDVLNTLRSQYGMAKLTHGRDGQEIGSPA